MSNSQEADLAAVMAAVRAAAGVGSSVLVLNTISSGPHAMVGRSQRSYRIDGPDGAACELPRWQCEHIRDLVAKDVVALGDLVHITCGGERLLASRLMIPPRTHELMPRMAMHAVQEMARTAHEQEE
ncbi:hypothetical protein [Crossiella sp. CA198]|uniref:hypothetical protein n=1 Tax=Crossiella sp. CA198 TaxID=3455607 RepID=UPI003F8D4506